jgi:lysophospholipase L1-like esterase
MSILSLMISLFIAELSLRFVAPVPDPYEDDKAPRLKQYIVSQYAPNTHWTTKVEQGLPGISGINRFTTNNMGFRGDNLVHPKPADEFRIFMVGGSTTECFYLDDSQAIHAALQNELAKLNHSGWTIKVYNAGRSGDRTYDHISMIVHRLVHLEPNMIIVFAGMNDLGAFDYLHFHERERRERLPLSRLVKMTATEFQVPRRLYYFLRGHLHGNPKDVFGEFTLTSNQRVFVQVRREAPITSEKPVTNTTYYRDNLITIAGVARAHRVRLVFMTQQATWNSSVDPQVENWTWGLYDSRLGKTYRADLADAALESLNDVMRQVAAEQQVPLYDLRKILPKSTEFFYDDMHFNVRGAQTAGKGLAGFIGERRLIPLR